MGLFSFLFGSAPAPKTQPSSGWRTDHKNGTASYKNHSIAGDDQNHDHIFSTQVYNPSTGRITAHEGSMATRDGEHTTESPRLGRHETRGERNRESR